LLFIVLGCISLNLLNWMPDDIYDDKIIFKYLGLVIYKGGVPYRDAFENKPPLIFFLNALTWLTSYRVTWVADTLLVLLATLMFYSLCRRKGMPWPWFLPLLFNLIIRNSLISYGNGMTREYTAVFLLIFFCVMFYKNAFKYYILGGLFALTLWMQQDAIIAILPMAFYTVFIQDSEPGLIPRRILYTAAGMFIVSLPVVFYFACTHSLYFLWHDAFLFNFYLPRQSASFFTEMKLIKHAIHDGEMDMVFYSAMMMGLAGLLITRRKRGLLLAAFLTLLLSFSAEYLTGRMQFGPGYMHYLLPLAASIPILVYVILTETEMVFFTDKNSRFIISSILSFVLVLGTLRYAHVVLFKESNSSLPAGQEEIDYLKKERLTDYQLYVFDDTYLISLYNKFGILSPSRWNYHFFGNSHFDWDKDPGLLNNILQDLQKHKTPFILDCSDAWNYPKNKLFYPGWKKFLQAHYTLVLKDTSNRMLWRIQ
jgi:hypothetical protein